MNTVLSDLLCQDYLLNDGLHRRGKQQIWKLLSYSQIVMYCDCGKVLLMFVSETLQCTCELSLLYLYLFNIPYLVNAAFRCTRYTRCLRQSMINCVFVNLIVSVRTSVCRPVCLSVSISVNHSVFILFLFLCQSV